VVVHGAAFWAVHIRLADVQRMRASFSFSGRFQTSLAVMKTK
jgi:hypothetical protein